VLCALGSALLYVTVNPLTMWLTFATFVGYAVIYTVILKPLTPQNIVIGGASGAMPPVLGWAAMRGDVGPEALILFLIIFLWTPPHFWALALYRVEDYRKSGLPMLPVTHGNEFTRLQILLYTLVLFAACLMPFAYGMSSWLYLAAAVVLSAGFTWYGVRAVARLLRRARAQDLPLFADPPERAVRGAAARPLPVLRPSAPCKRDAPPCAITLAAPWAWPLAACAARASRSSRPSTSPAPTTPRTSRCPTPTARCAAQGLPGKAVVVFFGYTQCPDVCPTTMAEIAQAKKLLGADGDKVQGVRVHHGRSRSATRRSC
jgi:hypothetical protein